MPLPGEARLERLALKPNWNPAQVADRVISLCESIWDAGWVFEKAEADALMESVLLYFRWPSGEITKTMGREEKDTLPGITPTGQIR